MHPELVFLTLGIGNALGAIRIGGIQPGSVIGVLLAGVGGHPARHLRRRLEVIVLLIG